jgi:tetratricopeptide (TPR) repeat protein
LAQVCNETKQYVEAHHFLDLAEAAVRRIGRADADFEFSRLLTLELTYYRENNFESALQTLDRACAVAEQSGNELQVAACSVNKFYTLSMLRRARQALDADRRALAIEERRFGHDSPNIPDRTAEIASQELALGRNHEALVDAQRALFLREHAATPNERDVGNSFTLAGQILAALGRESDARPQLERGLMLSEHALGTKDPDLTYQLQDLAELERKAGHLEAARSLLGRAIAINTAAGVGPAVAELLAHVAELEIARKRTSAALTSLTAAEAIIAKQQVRPDVRARVAFRRGSVRWQLGERISGVELVQNARTTLAQSDDSELKKRIETWRAASSPTARAPDQRSR